MIHLSLFVGIDASNEIKIKPHLGEFQPGDRHFVSFFPHDGLQDLPVSVEDVVYLAGCESRFPALGGVEVIFTFHTAKAFIASAGQRVATLFTLSVHF